MCSVKIIYNYESFMLTNLNWTQTTFSPYLNKGPLQQLLQLACVCPHSSVIQNNMSTSSVIHQPGLHRTLQTRLSLGVMNRQRQLLLHIHSASSRHTHSIMLVRVYLRVLSSVSHMKTCEQQASLHNHTRASVWQRETERQRERE